MQARERAAAGAAATFNWFPLVILTHGVYATRVELICNFVKRCRSTLWFHMCCKWKFSHFPCAVTWRQTSKSFGICQQWQREREREGRVELRAGQSLLIEPTSAINETTSYRCSSSSVRQARCPSTYPSAITRQWPLTVLQQYNRNHVNRCVCLCVCVLAKPICCTDRCTNIFFYTLWFLLAIKLVKRLFSVYFQCKF